MRETTNFLNRYFSGNLARIAQLRRMDSDFDELCDHFEELAQLLKTRASTKPAGPCEEIARALEELRQEIEEQLPKV